jgi:hypothetical protein
MQPAGWICLGCLLLAGPHARAGILTLAGTSSIEYETDMADAVVLGRLLPASNNIVGFFPDEVVAQARAERPPAGRGGGGGSRKPHGDTTVALDVERAFKGDLRGRVVLRISLDLALGIMDAYRPGQRVVVFVTEYKSSPFVSVPFFDPDIVDVACPQRYGDDAKLIPDEAALAARIERTANLPRTSNPISLLVDGSPNLPWLWLRIRRDAGARQRGLQWARSPQWVWRYNAILVLSQFDDPESREALRMLALDPRELDDPHLEPLTWRRIGGGKWAANTTPIRYEACVALATMGDMPPRVPISRPYCERVTTWVPFIVAAAALGAVAATGYIGRHRGRVVRIFTGASGASLMLMAVSLTLWTRGQTRIEDFALPVTQHCRFEAASLDGKLRILLSRQQLIQLPPTVTTVEVPRFWGDLWAAPLAQVNQRAVRGFGYGHGKTEFDSRGAEPALPQAMTYVTVPWWFVGALAAILPAGRIRLWLRDVRRRRRGLCVHCGYDLRASPERCPECGEPRHAISGRLARAPLL